MLTTVWFFFFFFFFNDTATTEIYTLSLHDALPISGGNLVSTAEEFADGEDSARQRLQISAYIEGFLQRDHTGPEHLEELNLTLQKLCGGEDNCNLQLLKESIEVLSRAAESRELRTAGHGDLVARY